MPPTHPLHPHRHRHRHRHRRGKVAVVTGGSQGIGRAICLTAAAHGADVVIHHLGESTLEAAQELAREIVDRLGQRALLVEGDVAQSSTADKVGG